MIRRCFRSLLLTGLCLLCLSATPRAEGLHLSVSAYPRVLFGGQDVRIKCLVPHIETYASVTYGVDGPALYSASTVLLPGPLIYTLLLHIPTRACGDYSAFCIVAQHDHLGDLRAVPMAFAVHGINCPEEEPEP